MLALILRKPTEKALDIEKICRAKEEARSTKDLAHGFNY